MSNLIEVKIVFESSVDDAVLDMWKRHPFSIIDYVNTIAKTHIGRIKKIRFREKVNERNTNTKER